MPSPIIVYSFRDSDDIGASCYETQDREEALRYAKKYSYLVVENVYEWQEAIPTEDFRPGAESTEEA